MQTVVKKWLRDKDFGFLENGNGPDIIVRKGDLVNCKFLKSGAVVEFECHQDQRGLKAKNVRLRRQENSNDNQWKFGVMK